MARGELPYREGDVFAVPLSDNSHAVGVAARIDGKGTVLGYFFGSTDDDLSETSELAQLSAGDAVLVKIFGDLGLIRGNWPVIGTLPGWRREDWPMPAFGRREELTGRYLRVEYPDDDPNGQPRETPIEREDFGPLPENGLAGFAWIEARLGRLLVNESR